VVPGVPWWTIWPEVWRANAGKVSTRYCFAKLFRCEYGPAAPPMFQNKKVHRAIPHRHTTHRVVTLHGMDQSPGSAEIAAAQVPHRQLITTVRSAQGIK